MRRETVLNGVRAALTGVSVPPLPPAGASEAGSGDPAVLAARFVREARAVGTVVHEVASRDEAVAALVTILADAAPAPRVIAWGTPLARALATAAATTRADVALRIVDRTTPLDAIADADVGITEADVLVAASGTLLLRSRGRARSVSLLPRTHVAVVGCERLVADLGSALRRLRAAEEPESSVTLVTGPSRTADIEKKLVVGVHGPCVLHVILLDHAEA